MATRFLVACLALVAGSAEARTMHCTAVSRATVKQQFTKFDQALLSRDAGKVSTLFAPDAVLLPTLSDEMRTTPAGIRDYFVHFLQKSPDGHVVSSETRIGCNEAVRMGNWSIEVTDPKTHEKSTVHARFTFVYRYSGGRWWIEHLHSSLTPAGH